MLIGIISDTHDRLERTAQAVNLLHHAQVQAIFHCGDICDHDILALFAGTPTYFVQGNNDDDASLRQAWKAMEHLQYLELGNTIELEGKKIGITHGHLGRITRELLLSEPDYLLSGHTHEARDARYNNVRCINPGALHRASNYSIATLDLVTDALTFLPIQ